MIQSKVVISPFLCNLELYENYNNKSKKAKNLDYSKQQTSFLKIKKQLKVIFII